MNKKENTTLGDLLKSDYTPQTIQEEMAKNLRVKLKKGIPTFEGLIGYENVVSMCMSYMSEDDIADMMDVNEISDRHYLENK